MPDPVDEFNDVILIFFGIGAWDYLTSLWFEYRLITQKVRFRWQFVPYFLARYTVVAFIVSNIVTTFVESPTLSLCSQAALGSLHLYLGLVAIAFGTWNLLVRVIIIWGHHPVLIKILFVVGILHLALAFIVATIGRSVCVPAPPSVVSVWIFGTATAVLEFAILVLSLVGIRRASPFGESHLARVLKNQGIAYFVMVFCIQLVTIIVNIAPTDGYTRMSVGVSGAILSPILSCRLVTSTLSQNGHIDGNPEPRTHRIECFELSEDRSGEPSVGRMTTCIDIETTKDQSVC